MWRRRVVPTRVAIYRVDSGDCDWNGNGGEGVGNSRIMQGLEQFRWEWKTLREKFVLFVE